MTPNRWRSFALAIVAAGMVGTASAQVSYFQNWNTGTTEQGWVDIPSDAFNSQPFAVNTIAPTTNCGGSGGSMRQLFQNPGARRGVRSPLLGNSTGGVTSLAFDYKVAINSANNVGADATSFTFEAFWGTTQNGPWQSLGLIDASNHVVSGTCASAPGISTFIPPVGSQVYVRFLATRFAQSILISFDNVSVQENPPMPCTATPTLGATVSSSNMVCAGSIVNLTVENPTTDTGISYQWFSSINGGTTWTPGPTTAAWNGVVVDQEIQFYVQAACAGNSPNTSTPVTVALGGFAMCGNYCVDNVGNNLADRGQVLSVTLTGENNDINYVFTGCPIGTTWVVDLLENQADLRQGSTYVLAVDFGTCTTQQPTTGEAWIDFDQNATFSPSERLGSVAGTPPALANTQFTFTVPVDAVPGPTRMRVVQNDNGIAPFDPCFGGAGQFSWGSVLDFTIIVVPFNTSIAPNSQADHTPLHGWPVPATSTLQLDRVVTATIYDMVGQVVGQVSRANVVDIGSLPYGAYLLRTEQGEVLRFIRE